MTRSGKGYKPVEKRVEKAVERAELVKEHDLNEPDDDLILEQLKKVKALCEYLEAPNALK